MQMGFERVNASIYIYDEQGKVLCMLPEFFKRDNQRTLLKHLAILFKGMKEGVSYAKRAAK